MATSRAVGVAVGPKDFVVRTFCGKVVIFIGFLPTYAFSPLMLIVYGRPGGLKLRAVKGKLVAVILFEIPQV